MKYSLIEIRPTTVRKKKRWVVLFTKDDQDRVRAKIKPNELGFMYYPKAWSDEKAFKVLRDFLISKHEVEITRLIKSVAALKKLQL